MQKLEADGSEKIFSEKYTGMKKESRKELEKLLSIVGMEMNSMREVEKKTNILLSNLKRIKKQTKEEKFTSGQQ
ncbi:MULTISPECIES: hypothetical protein [Enterococcus]|uniref:hypothetical protein n=1 Tax=Enterococcus sp. M190262 TaxID=2582830 RepID=UPI001F587EE8|nr:MULTISPECIES: hypothetical protein [Enterococcus]